MTLLPEPAIDVTDLAELDPSRLHQVDLYSEEVRQDLVPHVKQWREWGSFHTVIDGFPSAVFAGTADIREVYRDSDRFTVLKPRPPSSRSSTTTSTASR